MAIDLKKSKEEIEKATSIGEVKEASVDGKSIFSEEEKGLYFINTLITDEKDAKEVANLLLRIKKAKEDKKRDDKLVADLEAEKEYGTRGSLAYRVLNSPNNLVRKTIDYLVFLGKVIPEDSKAKREEKINELTKEIDKKRLERAENNKALEPLERELSRVIEDRDEAKKTADKRKKLALVVGGDLGKVEINNKKLSLIDLNAVHDYSTSTISTTLVTVNNDAESLINKAYGFLVFKDNNQDAPYDYIKTSLPGNYFNNRVFFDKESVFWNPNNIGYCLLKTFREFGIDKLKTLIKESGSSKKADLEKYAERMVEVIHWHEEIGGKGYHFELNKDTLKGWKDKSAKNLSNGFAKRGENQYPNIPSVDWKHVFEFMSEVFPDPKTTNKSYLTDPSDPNYIKPKDATKGWSDIKIKGFSQQPPFDTTTGRGHRHSMGWFKKNAPTDKEKQIAASEISSVNSIPADWNFRSVIQTWWDIAGSFFDRTTYDWKTGVDYETGPDLELKNSQQIMKFVKTMREIIHELGLSTELDEFDEYLVDIGGRAVKQHFIPNRKPEKFKQLTGLDQADLGLSYGGSTNYYKDLVEVYAEEAKGDNVRDYSKQLAKLITSAESNYSMYNGRVEGLNKQINEVNEKNCKLDFEINSIKSQIDTLRSLDDFDKKPLPDKKKSFNELYEKKDQGDKWLLESIKKMLGFLGLIEKEMDASEFESEKFKSKQSELEGILSDVQNVYGELSVYWTTVVENVPNKLTSGGIKKILEDSENGKANLEKISGLFKSLGEKIVLTDQEKDTRSKINEAITHPEKYKDTPQTPVVVVSEDDLKEAFGNIDGVVDKGLADKWGNAGVKKEEIQSIIEKITESDKKTPQAKFIEHLKGKGLDDGTKLNEKDDKDKIWKEFLGKEPERVAKTAFTCWLESDDNKSSTKTSMKNEVKNKDTDNEERLDMTNYGATTKDGEPDEKGMVKYLWEKAKGGSGLNYYKIKGESNGGNGGDTKEEGVLAHLKANWHWYGLAILAIIALLVVIFWKNISEWWNGPAEEEGKGAEDSEEEEKENE